MTFSVIRGEIIDATTHRYAATHVSGGGGYVTSGPAGVQGYVDSVRSTVTHHENKDLWIREFSSGVERQVTLADSNFAARAGHVVTLLRDDKSELYEYLCNESTGQETRNGMFNQTNLSIVTNPDRYVRFLFIALPVPVINYVALIALLYILVAKTPNRPKFKTGVGFYILTAFISGVATIIYSHDLANALSGRGGASGSALYFAVAAFAFWLSFNKSRRIGVDFLRRRLYAHDEAIKQAMQTPTRIHA